MFGKAIHWRAAAAIFVASALSATASGQATFTNLDGIIGQLSGPAAPYPSEIIVSGLTEPVALVRVRITGLSHELSSQEFDVLLVAPNGDGVILMSDVGAFAPVNGIDLVFDDQYPAFTVAPLVSGTFSPTNLDDGIGTDGFDAPAPIPNGTTLAHFRGKAGNGTWQLFVMDDTGGDAGTITSWALEIFQGACVTTSADSGSGSLRDAIDTANNVADLTTICFALPQSDPGFDPVSGTWMIAPASELPPITTPASIDGLTQLGASCAGIWPPTLKVVLNGSAAGAGASGLRLTPSADGSAIRGLVINGWTNRGVDLNGPDDCRVQGCFIGTDSTGLIEAGNGGNGVVVRNGAVGTVIGVDGDGTNDDCERNLISGNSPDGIVVMDLNTDETRIAGNFIGVDITGAAALGNAVRGICVQDSASDTIIGTNADGASDDAERNIISGNGGAGVHISQLALRTTLLGNTIGLDFSGASPLANGAHGVHADVAEGVIIGAIDPDSTPAQTRNIISGNGGRGIFAEDCPGIVVINNFIGTDITGLTDVGNIASGVRLDRCDGAEVGVVAAAETGNVLSGNGARGLRIVDCNGVTVSHSLIGIASDGVAALGNDAQGVLIEASGGVALTSNTISSNARDGVRIEGPGGRSAHAMLGNLVGTAGDGTLERGNGEDGVMVTAAADGVFITGGSPIAPEPNIIAFNDGNGVSVVGNGTERCFVRWNSIHSNTLLGVNLDGAGVNLNDPGLDPDSGPNDLINYPTITSIVGTTISGEYQGLPSTTFDIDVYQNADPDPSGHGEGQIYLGSAACTTDAAGFGTWMLSGAVFRTTPLHLAATATDQNVDIGTSEFGPVALTNLCKIACPTGPVELAAGPNCTAIAAYGVTIAGNCDPGVILTFDPPEGSVLPLGPTSVMATLRDAIGGLLDECEFTVQVIDQTPPTISCPVSVIQSNDPNECGAEVSVIVGVQDNCDPMPTIVYSIPDGMGGQLQIMFPRFFLVGTTTVTVNAADAASNAAVPCSFDIIINDTQGPTLSCPDIEVEADQFGNVVLTASLVFPNGVVDNCPDCSVETFAFNPPVIECALLQPYPIMATVQDCRGNTSTCTFTLTVTGPDCNANGVSDGCDISSGASDDCNENNIPDECECLWCNGEEPADIETATGQASHLGGGAPMGTWVVDDIYFPPGCVQHLTAFEGLMLTDSIAALRRATLELYDDCNGLPAALPFLTIGAEHSEVVSAVPTSDGLFLVKYRFDLCDQCIWLDGGKTYWVGLTGQTDNVNMSDLSFWVVDERPEARIMGRPPHKAEGTTIPGWGGQFVRGEWMSIQDCCIGCNNVVFCIYGDSCKVLWDNGPAGTTQADAAASPPSGAHRAFEARAADDYVSPTCVPQEVCLIDAWVWTDCEPPHGFVEFYRNDPCDTPSPDLEPFQRFWADKMIDTGHTATLFGRTYKLYIVRVVNPGLTLPVGQTGWLGAGVDSTGSFVVGSRFASVNDSCSQCDYTVAPAHARDIRPSVTTWLPIQPLGSLAFRIATRDTVEQFPASLPGDSPFCAADANGDGTVAVDDIFTFLSAWFVGCP